jgi:hypothetical protein
MLATRCFRVCFATPIAKQSLDAAVVWRNWLGCHAERSFKSQRKAAAFVARAG